jgi:hypothetical protein
MSFIRNYFDRQKKAKIDQWKKAKIDQTESNLKNMMIKYPTFKKGYENEMMKEKQRAFFERNERHQEQMKKNRIKQRAEMNKRNKEQDEKHREYNRALAERKGRNQEQMKKNEIERLLTNREYAERKGRNREQAEKNRIKQQAEIFNKMMEDPKVKQAYDNEMKKIEEEMSKEQAENRHGNHTTPGSIPNNYDSNNNSNQYSTVHYADNNNFKILKGGRKSRKNPRRNRSRRVRR